MRGHLLEQSAAMLRRHRADYDLGPAQCLGEISSRLNAIALFIAVGFAESGAQVPLMTAAVELLKLNPVAELIWASPRELLNIFQANDIGCHVITVTNDILKKLALVGTDLDAYSLDTVKMFRNDAVAAGFAL